MEYIDKIVDFEKYCKTCEHKNVEEKFDPCHECLNNPVNTHSKKPVNYKANVKLVAEENKKEATKEG